MLGGCGALDRGFLSPAGPVAQVIHDEFLFVCLIMLFVIVPVLLLVPLVAWHYRLSNTKSAYRPQWGFNWSLEGLIWIPPTAIVVMLAVFLWRDTHRLDPYKPLPGEAITVQAIAADWKWIFIYPEQGVATVNRLVIPAGRPVHLDLTSATVMQAILMPRLAGQICRHGGDAHPAQLPGRPARQLLRREHAVQRRRLPEREVRRRCDGRGRLRPLAGGRAGAAEPAGRRGIREAHAPQHAAAPACLCAVQPGLFDQVVSLQQPSGHALELAKLPPRPLPMAVDRACRTITGRPMNDPSFATFLFGQLSWGALPFVRAWRDPTSARSSAPGPGRSWCWARSARLR